MGVWSWPGAWTWAQFEASATCWGAAITCASVPEKAQGGLVNPALMVFQRGTYFRATVGSGGQWGSLQVTESRPDVLFPLSVVYGQGPQTRSNERIWRVATAWGLGSRLGLGLGAHYERRRVGHSNQEKGTPRWGLALLPWDRLLLSLFGSSQWEGVGVGFIAHTLWRMRWELRQNEWRWGNEFRVYRWFLWQVGWVQPHAGSGLGTLGVGLDVPHGGIYWAQTWSLKGRWEPSWRFDIQVGF